jgi:transglutaminase-like putative cysteine protease
MRAHLKPHLKPYLADSTIIDWKHPAVLSQARKLAAGADDPLETTRRCFEWVRDEIRHSGDYRLNPVTCSASVVLAGGTGFCYAKSHLLAALLRANGIPAGLCYQRLSRDDNGPPFCLHGLNAVFLPKFGWYRIDPRGNKPGVDAQFEPPVERLAFPLRLEGESDLPQIWADPRPDVLAALFRYRKWNDLWANLPDVAYDV